MTLTQYNQRYEDIIHSNLSNNEKDRKLAELLSDMEKAYKIPILRNKEWEKENKAVIALYRKISLSRQL